MGRDIEREEFEGHEFEKFSQRLDDGLSVLGSLLERPGFGEGPQSMGAELELYLVDANGLVAPVNERVLDTCADPRMTMELNRFNLEINARPTALAGSSFSVLEAELNEGVQLLESAASQHGAQVAAVGILPTLRRRDLGPHAISDRARYRVLSRTLRERRAGPFRIRIDGDEPFAMETDDVSLEGANTSFQVHLRVPPGDYAAFYNAAQLATGVVLSVAGNSPLLMGHQLWEETRVALFKQAVDARNVLDEGWHVPARVSFGHGWLRRSVLELFEESVALYRPILPLLSDEDPIAAFEEGEVPGLEELRLHNGTVWRWNRAIFEPGGGGHVRIEFRALPAGPSVQDMVANAAFLVGLTLGLAPQADRLVSRFPFAFAHRNFYRAAQSGLSSALLWPSPRPPSPRQLEARALVEELLPVAEEGLLGAGVAPEDVSRLLEIIAKRALTGRTGAMWQRTAFRRFLESGVSVEQANASVLKLYMERSRTGGTVADWDD